MNIQKMKKTAASVADLLKTLSHPKRLLLLCQMADKEVSVGQLAEMLDLREAAVSQQLMLLRKDKLVTTRRDGQTVYYSLARKDVAQLLAFLYDTYCKDQK
ncbi:MAG: winged helix-turn-helix transcriptional regulator [Rhodospirillaceae bacterium]|nr:winged helix-turn-helix transcriptional regulator [Rhodospirillaceae bacterium]